MKTSYTIPEVSDICRVSPRVVYKWIDGKRLIASVDSVNNCKIVSRENLILFMKRVGFSTEALEAESPPTKEEALKDLLYTERCLFFNLLQAEADRLKEENIDLGYFAILKKIKSFGTLEGKNDSDQLQS